MNASRVIRLTRRKESSAKERQIVLFGDSHSYAVQRAVEKRQGKGRSAPLSARRLLKIKNGKPLGDTSFEELIALVGSLGPEDVVLSMIGGNQHAAFSLIQHPQRYDFLEERKDQVAEGAELIPYRVLAATFEDGIRNRDGKSLQALREATAARVIHIIPPPPKGDNEFIESFHESIFALEGISELGVSSPALRLKVWALQKKILEELCAEIGIEIMLPPRKTVDKEGFLKREFYANDATHANHLYGEYVLRDVESVFGADTNDQVHA